VLGNFIGNLSYIALTLTQLLNQSNLRETDKSVLEKL